MKERGSEDTVPTNSARYYFLDGMRGWAALCVMLLHVFFGSLPVGDHSDLKMHLWWSFNGDYMVGLFFVVSGFALSASYVARGNRRELWRIAGGRYFRLLIPIFAVCLLVTLFLRFGVFPEPDARIPSYRNEYNLEPTVINLFRFSFFDVFFAYDGSMTYGGPLWTMAYELMGSYALLLLLFLVRPRFWRMAFGSVLAIYLLAIESYYSLFLVGALAADIYILVNLAGMRQKKALISLSVILLMAGYFSTRFAPTSMTVLLLSVSLWFFGSIFNPAMRAFLESPVSRFLGLISFPLYLVHEAMIVAVGMPVYIVAVTSWERWFADMLTVIASILSAIVLVPIDKLAMIVSRRVGNAIASAVGWGWKRSRFAGT